MLTPYSWFIFDGEKLKKRNLREMTFVIEMQITFCEHAHLYTLVTVLPVLPINKKYNNKIESSLKKFFEYYLRS